jgi:hypothetical protein
MVGATSIDQQEQEPTSAAGGPGPNKGFCFTPKLWGLEYITLTYENELFTLKLSKTAQITVWISFEKS